MTARLDEVYRALRHANDQTQLALSAANMGVWELDTGATEVTWSPAMAAVFGLAPETAPRSLDAVLACIHPDDRAMVADALAREQDYELEFRVIWPDQSIHWLNGRAQVATDEGPGHYLGVSGDITERKLLEEALYLEKERAQVTLHSIGDAVISTDLEGRVTYLNAVAERLTGWSASDASTRPLLEVLQILDATTRQPVDDPGALAVRLKRVVGLGGNCLLVQKNGGELLIEDSAAPIHDRDGRVTGAVVVFRDVSAERALTAKMARLAQYDPLTDLPNRTLLQDRIAQAITAARRSGSPLAVVYVDIDHFKQVNDSLGHAVGDALLRSVTARLLACVRGSDTVSRRGGDEFVVLLPQLTDADSTGVTAGRILRAVAAPHTVLEHVLHVTASLGVSVYPDDGDTAETLIGAADVAMYHAKQNGRSHVQFFRSEMNARAMARRILEGSLRDALRRDEFALHYQPKIDLTTGQMTGAEALVRWQHPTRGLLAPGEFVTAAEESGLILPIGRWVLSEACRQAQAWQADGLPAVRIAVNVSPIEFRATDFLSHVRAVLDDSGWPAEYLELEVTEGALMARAESTTDVLQSLKTLGVQLAIDDFGTGYSSLSYLSRFPIDTLKIDRSFVRGMTVGGADAAIINAIIAMGRSLNQRVVAEGIETQEQLSLLQQLHCGEGQGFYFCRPVPAARFEEMLRRERSA